jgi:hypothetical protein
MIGDNEKVYKIAGMLQKNGIFVAGIVYSAVLCNTKVNFPAIGLISATHRTRVRLFWER